MTPITVDHTSTGLSRIPLQYQNSPRFKSWITALLKFGKELEALFELISLQSDIDIAEGVNLDVIGIIVGRSRIIPAAIPVGFFGFQGQPGVFAYGEEGDLSKGGRFRDETEPAFASTVLADPEYRRLLRTKIIRNHSHGRSDETLAGLAMLIPDATVVVSDNGVMSMQIGVGRILRYWERVIVRDLDILSRPAGVEINSFTQWEDANYLGFFGQPNAKGFAEEGSSIGGKLAEEF